MKIEHFFLFFDSELNAENKKKNTAVSRMKGANQIHRLIPGWYAGGAFGYFLIIRKAPDARRRGATTEAYGAIRRKEERAKATPQMMP
jgi:hypothetical protein